MSSSVAVFDDGLAHHDWSRPPRNGDSRTFYPDQAVPAQFDAAESWPQMPATQLPSFDSPASTQFHTYHPAASQIISNTSTPHYPQSRPPVAMHQYHQQGVYASHERPHATPTPYLASSEPQAQSSPIDSTSASPQYSRYSYETPRASYSSDDYSTPPSNVLYGSQPVPHGGPGPMPGSTTYEQPHNSSSGDGATGGDAAYSYVQSNANSLAYSEPVAPQPQRPRADFTQVGRHCAILLTISNFYRHQTIV